ncbi:hypothetical protein [Sphingopyxis sp. MWB1]|uniref:hypothetical protein n=1 Tax=Sphingopyxis sp. MWB1 TaxID=1537715 RepID=UPI0011857AEA|nr:hypothetical protein [Sphingopyxis sp. MWB1]
MSINIFGPPFDWAATGSMVQGVATLVGAIAVLGAAKMGADTFEAWRRQKVTERHIEQAERILTAAYKARRALKYVRSPLVDGWELAAAEEHFKDNHGADWENRAGENQQRLKTVRALQNRLIKTADEWSELNEVLPAARALFGPDLEDAVEKLARQFIDVNIMLEAHMDDRGADPDYTREVKAAIYDVAPHGSVNAVTAVINEAVAEIETICLPTIRLEGPKTSVIKK